MKVTYSINDGKTVLRRVGLNDGGRAQAFHTANVMKRMSKYMPYRTGATIKLMTIRTDVRKPQVVVDTPYARYLYYGMLMVDPITGKGAFYNPDTDRYWSRPGVRKVLTNTPLKFNTGKNPQAGPYWDRRLWRAEGNTIVAELQAFVNREGSKGK